MEKKKLIFTNFDIFYDNLTSTYLVKSKKKNVI